PLTGDLLCQRRELAGERLRPCAVYATFEDEGSTGRLEDRQRVCLSGRTRDQQVLVVDEQAALVRQGRSNAGPGGHRAGRIQLASDGQSQHVVDSWPSGACAGMQSAAERARGVLTPRVCPPAYPPRTSSESGLREHPRNREGSDIDLIQRHPPQHSIRASL